MGNFGFSKPRVATMPGLNAKLSEIGALLALQKLEGIDRVLAHRAALAETYRAELPDCTFQSGSGRQAYQFMSMLLPVHCADHCDKIRAFLSEHGIESGTYFSPHLAQHPYFREVSTLGNLTNTDRIAARVLSLPMSDFRRPLGFFAVRIIVQAGTVDVIVVYKVDRLTRSLADFAKLVELFDQHGVSFVSVTQQFNTTDTPLAATRRAGAGRRPNPLPIDPPAWSWARDAEPVANAARLNKVRRVSLMRSPISVTR